MYRFSLLILLIGLCFSCNKKEEEEIKAGNSVATPWSWRTPLAHPLALDGNVLTIAGFPGDAGSLDGIGNYATFFAPMGIISDGTFLYVCDGNNETIRKINIETTEVMTLAGKTEVIAHVDGIGTAASFDQIRMITTDGNSLFVTEASTIRKIDLATYRVTTLAGSPTVAGTANGVGSAARFDYPDGITTDGVNLYVAESQSHRIRKVVIATGEVTTLAGSTGILGSANGVGSGARFKYPSGIITDGTYLYVTDSGNNTIRKIEISTGMVTTLAGDASVAAGHADGRGRFARFNDPYNITSDGTNLYVSEYTGRTVRKIVISTGESTTVAGAFANSLVTQDGVGSSASFNNPFAITTDGRSLFLSEGEVIRKIE